MNIKNNKLEEEGKKENVPEFISGFPIGEIVRSIRSIHFGSIQIIVQDSKVIQIDKTEKKRINDY